MMFADDTKIWTKIKDSGDSELLQQNLNLLMECSKKWLLSFNMDKCKVMHIGHETPTVYTMSDGNNTICLELRKTLVSGWPRTWNQRNNVFKLQKSSVVLGMTNRHFKTIDKKIWDNIRHTSVHISSIVSQAWSPQLQKDKKMSGKSTKEGNQNGQMIQETSIRETRSKKLGIYSLDKRRLGYVEI